MDAESRRTQAQRVLEHLESGRTITSLGGLREYGIIQFPRRIYDLRHAGYPITDRFIRVRNRFGEMCRVKEYRLER